MSNNKPALNIDAMDPHSMGELLSVGLWFYIIPAVALGFVYLTEGISFWQQYLFLGVVGVLLILDIIWYFSLKKELSKSPAKILLFVGICLLSSAFIFLTSGIFVMLSAKMAIAWSHILVLSGGTLATIAFFIYKHRLYKYGDSKNEGKKKKAPSVILAVVITSILVALLRIFGDKLHITADSATPNWLFFGFFLFVIMSLLFLHNFYIAKKEHIGI